MRKVFAGATSGIEANVFRCSESASLAGLTTGWAARMALFRPGRKGVGWQNIRSEHTGSFDPPRPFSLQLIKSETCFMCDFMGAARWLFLQEAGDDIPFFLFRIGGSDQSLLQSTGAVDRAWIHPRAKVRAEIDPTDAE